MCFFRVVFQSPVLLLLQRLFGFFCCTHKKLGVRKWGSNFAGSKTPTRLTVVYMLNIVSSKEAHLWPQKFQSTNSLSFIFVVKIQISLAKIHMQPSKNEGLLPMIFHFKGWFFKLFLLALHFSRMGEGHFTEKNRPKQLFFAAKPGCFWENPRRAWKVWPWAENATIWRRCCDAKRGIGDVEWLFPLAKES